MNNQIFQNLKEWLNRQTSPNSIKQADDIGAVIGTTMGIIRSENQDRAIVVRYRNQNPQQSFLFFALCDGIGGLRDGGLCATLTLSAMVASLVASPPKSLSIRLREAVETANEAVYKLYHEEGGTTLSAVLFGVLENPIGINVGDSRIYQYSSQSIQQISIDGTLAGLVKQSKGTDTVNLDESDISKSLVQYVGFKELQFSLIESLNNNQAGILLSTDGIHVLHPQLFEKIITYAPSPYEMVKRLIHISKWCGGKDNASAICIPPKIASGMAANSLNTFNVLEIWDSFDKAFLYPETVSSTYLTARKERPPRENGLGEQSPHHPPASGNRAKKTNVPTRDEVSMNLDKYPKAEITIGDYHDRTS